MINIHEFRSSLIIVCFILLLTLTLTPTLTPTTTLTVTVTVTLTLTLTLTLVSAVCKLCQWLCSTKRPKAIRAKVERERSGSLVYFICPQASFLSLGKSYIASLAALRLRITTKATQCGIVSVFYFMSCVSQKAKD